MKFMIENVSAGPNPNKARRFLVEHPEASHQLLSLIKTALVKHLVHQIKAGAQVSERLVNTYCYFGRPPARHEYFYF